MALTAYGYGKTVPYGYDDAVRRVTEALQEEGFGVLTEIDVRETLRRKLGVEDFARYVILGACNPHLAHRALQAERELGLLLPCNVIVYEDDDGTHVSILNPMEALGLVGNAALEPIAQEADRRLRRVLEAL